MKNEFHILLADDDRDDRYFFDLALKELPIKTYLTTVENGEKLMRFLSENPEHFPDVLFLDLNMPRKNGSECLKEIKNNEKLKKLPVIIYSTSLHDEIADLLYQNGAHYYLQKCNFDVLKKQLQRIFGILGENTNRPTREKFIISAEQLTNETGK